MGEYKIIITRESAVAGAAKTYKIEMDGFLVGKLGNGQSLEISTSEGPHTLSFTGFGKVEKNIQLFVQPQQYVTKIYAQLNKWSGKIELSINGVTESLVTDNTPLTQTSDARSKFCQHCGEKIDADCVICPNCGKQVAQLKQEQPNIVINNTNTAVAGVVADGRMKNKWVAFLLCLFLGEFGFHKFYEGKIGMGILYLFTLGLFGIGWLIDTIVLLCKPNPYFV